MGYSNDPWISLKAEITSPCYHTKKVFTCKSPATSFPLVYRIIVGLVLQKKNINDNQSIKLSQQ